MFGVALLFLVLAFSGSCIWSAIHEINKQMGLLAVLLFSPLYYICFAAIYATLSVAIKWTVLGTLAPGRYPLYGFTHIRFWVVNLFLHFGMTWILYPFNATSFLTYYLICLGGSIHPSVLFDACAPQGGSIALVDADMLQISKGVTIRDGSMLRGHMFIDGELVVGRILLEEGASVWKRSIMEPFTKLGTHSILSPHSVFSLGMEAPAFTKWRGVTAKLVARNVETCATAKALQLSNFKRIAHLILVAIIFYPRSWLYSTAVLPASFSALLGMLLYKY